MHMNTTNCPHTHLGGSLALLTDPFLAAVPLGERQVH